MPFHTNNRPYFDAAHLPTSVPSYVAWVDVMGVRAIMSRSLAITGNFLFKLHVAALEAPRNEIVLYPVMDGIYVVSARQRPMREFLEYIMTRTADLFVSTAEMQHRFLVKGALAYGPVIHGCDVTAEASNTLHASPEYRSSILLGMPMIQALLSEPKAPPFGVYIHESACAFAPGGDRPFTRVWWS